MSVLINLHSVEEELIVFLRNSNILSVATRGVTTTSDSFSGTGAIQTFTFTQKAIKNVRTVLVNSLPLANFTDYTIDYKNNDPSSYPTITFTTPPSAGTNNIVITYDYGTDKIYSDYPRVDLKLDSYPRVSVYCTSIRTNPLGIGGKSVISDIIVELRVYADNSNAIDSVINNARWLIIQNQTSFYNFRYVNPMSTSVMLKDAGRHEKIVWRSQEFMIRLQYETK